MSITAAGSSSDADNSFTMGTDRIVDRGHRFNTNVPIQENLVLVTSQPVQEYRLPSQKSIDIIRGGSWCAWQIMHVFATHERAIYLLGNSLEYLQRSRTLPSCDREAIRMPLSSNNPITILVI